MGKKKNKKTKDDPNFQTVCRNRKARFQYEILDKMECGIVLKGSEVKSVRNRKVSIEEAYGRLRDGELWLIGCDIAEYPQATVMNHEPKRPRKLLLHKKELHKFAETATHRGLTVIPLSVYFSRGIVKVQMAVAQGKKLHDKREKHKEAAHLREMQAATRGR